MIRLARRAFRSFRAPLPIPENLDERVARGVQLLDRYGPSEWWERVDRSTLSINSQYRCIVSQVYNDSFGYGMTKLLPYREGAITEYGFAGGWDIQREWHRVLALRQKSRVLVKVVHRPADEYVDEYVETLR